MPDLVRVEPDPAFDLVHVRLARAACIRIEGADQTRNRIWNFRSDGSLGPRAEHTWDQVSDEYQGPVGDRLDHNPIRCAIVLDRDPARWEIEVEAIDVGGHAAIVAPLEILCDTRSWPRLRPHTVIATGSPVGVALVTRGRYPADRQLRLVLV